MRRTARPRIPTAASLRRGRAAADRFRALLDRPRDHRGRPAGLIARLRGSNDHQLPQSNNSAFGVAALNVNPGSGNSAFGSYALVGNRTGGENSAFGWNALRSNESFRNSAFGSGALAHNTGGFVNDAFGTGALGSNTTGYQNSAFGTFALAANTTGFFNTAFGNGALLYNTTGPGNSAFGFSALYYNTGVRNSAFRRFALRHNTTGHDNVAVGSYAGAELTTGSENIFIGMDSGRGQTTGNSNIYIGRYAPVAGESGRIRIGSIGSQGTYIGGIINSSAPGGVGVIVNSAGKLGTTISSARFKQDVRDMGDASDVLMKLRPVTFRYREDVVGTDDAKTPQYGLIAEEVEQVAAELVAPDAEGKPYPVKYHELPALLVNEAQKDHQAIAEQQTKIDQQAAVIEAQRLENEAQQREIAALTTRLARIEPRVSGARH